MSLTSNLKQSFSSKIRNRGQSYYHDGLVSIVEGDHLQVQATVLGTGAFDVILDRTDSAVKVSCTCPYYTDYVTTCKHIWATLLEAEEQGFLTGTGAARPPSGIEFGRTEDDDHEGNESPRFIEPSQTRFRGERKQKPEPKKDWERHLVDLQRAYESKSRDDEDGFTGREVLYIVDGPLTFEKQKGLILETAIRERKLDGDWSKPKTVTISSSIIPRLPDPIDRQVLAMLTGAREVTSFSYYSGYSIDSITKTHQVSRTLLESILPLMCKTGRCFLRRPSDEELIPLEWRGGPPWKFHMRITADESGTGFEVTGEFRQGENIMPIAQPELLVAGGIVFSEDWAAPLEDSGEFEWIAFLRTEPNFKFSEKQKENFLNQFLQIPVLPQLELPEEMQFEEVSLSPRPCLKVISDDHGYSRQSKLQAELSFDYDGVLVEHSQHGGGVYDATGRRFIRRDHDGERSASERLHQLGFRRKSSYQRNYSLELAARHLQRVVAALLQDGWHVEAEGKIYKKPGVFQIAVSSGIDWFDLEGTVDFGEVSASLPALLIALQKGENTVLLDDGTYGLLPEEWLKKFGPLAGLGSEENGSLRFKKNQVGILDALLAAQPDAKVDELFKQTRDKLRRFEGIEPVQEPDGFRGQLRDYQKEGLGWLHFLQQFRIGGCLADDMGLGKTVQVLALLESRRELREKAASSQNGKTTEPGPSLVVVPASLVFNWRNEAARFTPKMRVLEHTGTGRPKNPEAFNDYDLVLTTYGTLRQDAPKLKDFTFDYCILDESQAIKNAKTASAKAVRLIKAEHRLSMSGTPIENHIGELWSLFEFLNAGMLGSASVFNLLAGNSKNMDEEAKGLLAKALRPYILRRSKEEVAKELPSKVEQTIYCELEKPQRKLYDELRDHYRQSLMPKINSNGLNRSKIQILEALLRLRQASIHPGLIDESKSHGASAKLDLLVPQLMEVYEGNHKALVFSQFTKMLGILGERLDSEGLPYEYLDGRTRKREERVEHFQNDPDCRLFLISLKAGGLGLNLTAAEYVFLLDPWWNPAVEAQAIDRTHRIGQTRQVFAYRLIARDTVEEKVIELQETKRALADAIISSENSLIRNLQKEDLELLLS